MASSVNAEPGHAVTRSERSSLAWTYFFFSYLGLALSHFSWQDCSWVSFLLEEQPRMDNTPRRATANGKIVRPAGEQDFMAVEAEKGIGAPVSRFAEEDIGQGHGLC